MGVRGSAPAVRLRKPNLTIRLPSPCFSFGPSFRSATRSSLPPALQPAGVGGGAALPGRAPAGWAAAAAAGGAARGRAGQPGGGAGGAGGLRRAPHAVSGRGVGRAGGERAGRREGGGGRARQRAGERVGERFRAQAGGAGVVDTSPN